MKTILIISGGIEAVPGIQLARDMGLHVVVSDGDPYAPGFEYAHDRINASTYDILETVNKAKHYHENKRKLDGVICIASDIPLTVASVAAELDLPGIPLESARVAMDKMAMKDKFNADGLLVPNYSRVYSVNDLKRAIKKWGYQLVLKPVDNRGARGVLKITEEVDLDWAWQFSKENSPTHRVMVEQFVDGPQISTESLVIDGNCYTIGMSDRNYEYLKRFAPFIIENGGDLPSHISTPIKIKIEQIVMKAARSLGVKDGVVKGDIVIDNDEPCIIELAARLSGGYFCTHEIPLNTGVDFVGNALKISIGEEININELSPKYSRPVSQRYFFPPPGRLKRIIGLDDLEKHEAVMHYSIRVKPGDTIPEQIAHPSRAGMVITVGETRDEASKAAIEAIDMIEFELQ